jgi:hypothetical protein
MVSMTTTIATGPNYGQRYGRAIHGSVVIALRAIPLNEVDDHAREQVNGLAVLCRRDLDDLGLVSANRSAAEACPSVAADCPCLYNIQAIVDRRDSVRQPEADPSIGVHSSIRVRN